MEGPDHKASLTPRELNDMVRAIREIELAMGDGVKRPTSTELENRIVARKSIVASASIEKGEKFTERNLSTKRPGSGISPIDYWELLGTYAKQKFDKDDLIV